MPSHRNVDEIHSRTSSAVTETTDDAVSLTSTQLYEERVRKSENVWFSGYLSGNEYVPFPKQVDENKMDDEDRERLLKEATYIMPNGARFHTSNLPPILQEKPTGSLFTGLIVYMALAFVAFVFLLTASCPIPWYRGKNKTVNGYNYHSVQFTLWKQKGGGHPTISTRTINDCPIQKHFYQTIAASTIMGCCFTFISMICAAAKLFGRGNYGWTFLFGFIAFAWSLCGNAMSISQFHLDRCAQPRLVTIARLDAGFALTLIAWIFLAVGLVVMLLTTKMNIGPILKQLRRMDTYYLILIILALFFTVIANTLTIWKRHFGTDEVRVVRVTYWHIELIKGDGTSLIFGRAMYRCSAFNKRIKASVSFLILGSVALFIAAMCGIGAFNSRGLRITSCVVTIVASCFLFVSWVTAVALFYRESCKGTVEGSTYANYPGVPSGVYNGRTKFDGYGVQEGVILSIIGWILCTAAVIINFIVPWTVQKDVN